MYLDSIDLTHLNGMITSKLNKKEYNKVIRILAKHNIQITSVMWDGFNTHNYFHHLHFMSTDSVGNINIIHGITNPQANHKMVKTNIFINTLLKAGTKFDIYSKRLNKKKYTFR